MQFNILMHHSSFSKRSFHIARITWLYRSNTTHVFMTVWTYSEETPCEYTILSCYLVTTSHCSPPVCTPPWDLCGRLTMPLIILIKPFSLEKVTYTNLKAAPLPIVPAVKIISLDVHTWTAWENSFYLLLCQAEMNAINMMYVSYQRSMVDIVLVNKTKYKITSRKSSLNSSFDIHSCQSKDNPQNMLICLLHLWDRDTVLYLMYINKSLYIKRTIYYIHMDVYLTWHISRGDFPSHHINLPSPQARWSHVAVCQLSQQVFTSG